MTWGLWVLVGLGVLCVYVILRDTVWNAPMGTQRGEGAAREGTEDAAVNVGVEAGAGDVFETDDRVWIETTGLRAGGVLLGRVDPEEVPPAQRRWMVFLDLPIKNECGLWRAVCVMQESLTRLPRSTHASMHNTASSAQHQ